MYRQNFIETLAFEFKYYKIVTIKLKNNLIAIRWVTIIFSLAIEKGEGLG